MHWIASWLCIALALWVSCMMLDKMSIKGGAGSYLVVAALFGILHYMLGKLLFAVLGIASFGLAFLFSFVTKLVVSALLLKVADSLSSRLRVEGFATAIWAALIMTAVNEGVRWVLPYT